jgi:DNA (cytosine-5)-methyltransferase 1
VFGFGVVTDDDGSYDNGNNVHGIDSGGIQLYLSAIKDFKIEVGAKSLFISIWTDATWYRLGNPSMQYTSEFQMAKKAAQIAVKAIKILKLADRVSKLPFSEVIKHLAAAKPEDPTYISANRGEVKSYVVTHGAIICWQFADYPDKWVNTSAFFSTLKAKMGN